jgi:hypothetical protein
VLKEKLMQQQIVVYPKREGRFMLRTDACLGDKDNVVGLGAVLLQQQSTTGDEEKAWKVIAYASRPLKKHKKNYSAYLVEMAAAVWGIEHFDVYLIGKQFTLVTDHRPLEHLASVHTKTLNRLQHLMLEYQLHDRVQGRGRERGGRLSEQKRNHDGHSISTGAGQHIEHIRRRWTRARMSSWRTS